MSEFPRVTEVLRTYLEYHNVPEHILSNAAERGRCVHALCEQIAKGQWIPDGMIKPEHLGYVNSFKLWFDAQVDKVLITEKRYTHDKHEYSGQVDMVVLGSDKHKYLVDLKTSYKPQKTYPLQMGAYDCLLGYHGVETDGAMIVYLSKDGDFPEVNLIEDLSEEKDVFLAALTCWHYFNKGKKRGRSKAA